MSSAAIGIAWGLCVLFTFRPTFRWLVKEEGCDSWGDFVWLLWMTAVPVALAAPLIVFCWAWQRSVGTVTDARTFARSMAGESRADKVKRLEREAAKRERYIADLERETEVVK